MINRAILIGNVGGNPELKSTTGGATVCTFSVATSERWKDKSGSMQEETCWHNVVAWNKLAEVCAEYLHKGDRVYIEGKIKTRKYQDQSGTDRYVTEIVAREMKNLTSRKSEEPHTTGEDVPF